MPHSDGYRYDWSSNERPRKYPASELSTMYRGVFTEFARNILDVNDHLESLERGYSGHRSYRNRYENPPYFDDAASREHRRIIYRRFVTPERRFNEEYYRNEEYGDSAGRRTATGGHRNEHHDYRAYNERQMYPERSDVATSRTEGGRIERRDCEHVNGDTTPSRGTARLLLTTEMRSVGNNAVEDVRVGDESENSTSEDSRRTRSDTGKKGTSSQKKKQKSSKTSAVANQPSQYAAKTPTSRRPGKTNEKRRSLRGHDDEVDEDDQDVNRCVRRGSSMEDSTEDAGKGPQLSELTPLSAGAEGEASYSTGEVFSGSLAEQEDSSGASKSQRNARRASAASRDLGSSDYEEEESTQQGDDEEKSNDTDEAMSDVAEEASAERENGRDQEHHDDNGEDNDNDAAMLDISNRSGESREPTRKKTLRESAEDRKRRLAAARREIERENVPKPTRLPLDASRERFQRTCKKKIDPESYRTGFSDGFAYGYERALRIHKLFGSNDE